MSILNGVNSPIDLKQLPKEDIAALCEEIRTFLINNISATGGHLAANLGVVELTVAILRCFNPPDDKIIFDVGHQSYVYKMLTGRRDRFQTLRSFGGLCGFPRPSESEYDAFCTGHSSTSISAALGISEGLRLLGTDAFTVAVIGDGAMTGGLSFEGLNNAGKIGKKLIIVLNDNEHSISKNVGALAAYLSELTSRPNYFKAKDRTKRVLRRVPFIGEPIIKAAHRIKSAFKSLIMSRTIFEELGFEYFGPINGHDEARLQELFERAKSLDKPSVIHIKTTKGKGYAFAEKKPDMYHGISHFDVKSGQPTTNSGESFSSVFGAKICALAKENERVCAITAAMSDGVGLCAFEAGFAERFYDVGIAEGHALTFAAGLSAAGARPYVAVYSSFLQRAYDEILHDVCLDGKAVTICIDRAGLVGEDGDTHQGIFDLPMLLPMPGIEIYSPSTFSQLEGCLERTKNAEHPVAIRYPRGGEWRCEFDFCTDDYCTARDSGAKILLVTYGRITALCRDALDDLQRDGYDCALLSLIKLKPISEQTLKIIQKSERIIFVEESIKTGSVGEHLLTLLSEAGINCDFSILAVADRFVPHGSVPQLLELCGLSREGIYNFVTGENKK